MMTTMFLKKLLRWIEEDKIIRFYQSRQWRQVRAKRLALDNFECQLCKVDGKYHKAETVHHIEHVKDRPTRALDITNLVSLCKRCHNKEHPEKLILEKSQFTNSEKW